MPSTTLKRSLDDGTAAAQQPIKKLRTSDSSNRKHATSSKDRPVFRRDDKPFRLMDLPTEVRLEIYRACIVRPYRVTLSKIPQKRTSDENDTEDEDRSNARLRRSVRLRNNALLIRPIHRMPPLPPLPVVVRKPKAQDGDELLVNLLATCQLVYREARPVMYGENRFDLDIDTARYTLASLHQRSRGCIRSLRLDIPPGSESLERFTELSRLGLRYCWRLRTFTIKLTSAYQSGSHANIYANAFDNLRWLPRDCEVNLEGHIDPEVAKVVQLKAALAKSLDEEAYARRQLMSSDKSFPHFAVEGFGKRRS